LELISTVTLINLPGSYFRHNIIENTNYLVAELVLDNTTVWFDLSTGDIVNVVSSNPTYTFANGSVLYYGLYVGYFLQTGNTWTYTELPIDYVYRDPNDVDNVWFVSVAGSQYNMNNLNLVTKLTSEGVTTYQINNFPTQYLYFIIFEITQDENENVFLAYSTGSEVCIVNQTSTVFVRNDTSLTQSLSLNLSNGTFTLITGSAGKVFIHKFELFTGQVISSITLNAGLLNYPVRLSDRYHLIGESYTNHSNLVLWDTVTESIISQVHNNISLGYAIENYPFFPVGVDESSPTIYQGIVVQEISKLFLINNQGASVELTDYEIGFIDSELLGDNLIYVYLFNVGNGLRSSITIEITNWNGEEKSELIA